MAEWSGRLSGHELQNEGAAFERLAGYRKPYRHRRLLPGGGTSGQGRGVCSCGEDSEVLDSGSQRKRWHREHKAAVASRG